MVVHVNSLAFQGINVLDVDVQVQISAGIPAFTVVGLPDKTITESRERVRAAMSAVGLALPPKKILINLAPADLFKEGSHFDLAIACGILGYMGILPADELKDYIVLGELSLDGRIIGISGTLPAAIGANARNKGLICAQENGSEAAWSGNKSILAPRNILSLINHFKGTQVLSQPEPELNDYSEDFIHELDLVDVKGQDSAKRALEIAAAGGHNMLMFGPPGSGKSMLAKALPSILPEMTIEEVLECSMIASVAGLISEGKLTKIRPFRAPHHSCSVAAMVGGGFGNRVKPGEISLSHNGVLFLDELPEFPSSVIEALRQPIESGEVLISRAHAHIKYPSRCQLIAAMNPCRCGYVDEPAKACNRAPKCAADYTQRISGPIMDRFDIHIEVPTVEVWHNDSYKKESSKVVGDRVKKARKTQLERYEGYGIRTNSQLYGNLLTDHTCYDNEGMDILNKSAQKFRISMRAYNKILKIARTIADLEDSTHVYKHHIAEAISYRQIDWNYKT